MTDLVEGCGVEPRLAARTRDIRDWCACSSSTETRLSRTWRTVHEFQLGIQGLPLLGFFRISYASWNALASLNRQIFAFRHEGETSTVSDSGFVVGHFSQKGDGLLGHC